MYTLYIAILLYLYMKMIAKELGVILSFMVVATLAKNIGPSGYPSLHHRPPFPGTGPSPGLPGSSGTYIQYLYYLYRTQGPNSSSFLQYYQYLIRTGILPRGRFPFGGAGGSLGSPFGGLPGTEQISVKSRELSFEHLWIYYILSNDKENIPNTFAGMNMIARELGVILSFMVVATLAKNINPSGYPSLHHRPPFPGTSPAPGVPGSSGTYIQYLYYLYRTQGPNSSSFLQYYQYLIRTGILPRGRFPFGGAGGSPGSPFGGLSGASPFSSLPGLNAGSSFPGGSTFPGASSGSPFGSRSPFGSNQMISLSGSSSFSGLSNPPSFGDFDGDSYYTPDLDSGYGSSLPGYDSSPSYSEYNPYLIDIPTYNYPFMNKLFLK
uniref:Uncharacterized protein n=1 Tax=Magallana gigas TaxID=29159 RepID=K1RBK9_MAGGI